MPKQRVQIKDCGGTIHEMDVEISIVLPDESEVLTPEKIEEYRSDLGMAIMDDRRILKAEF